MTWPSRRPSTLGGKRRLLLMQGELVPALPRLPWFIPLLVLGMLVGEYLHHRVNEQRFRQLVYGLLLVTGTILTLQSL